MERCPGSRNACPGLDGLVWSGDFGWTRSVVTPSSFLLRLAGAPLSCLLDDTAVLIPPRLKQPKVLVQSVAGGVGLFAAEIIQHFGGSVVGIIGTPSKQAFIEDRFSSKSVTTVLRGDSRTFAARVGKDFAIVFDAVAGPYFDPSMVPFLDLYVQTM